MNSPFHHSLHFARSLSISIGMALATSCFAMIAGMASRTGWWLLPAIVTSLLIALAVAHAIGRLSRRFPSALGIRTYVKAAFGNTTSLFFVFLYLVMIGLVASVESNLYASIVQQVLPAIDARWIVVVVFVAVLAINSLGHEFSRSAQLGLVAMMLIGIVALSVGGLVLGSGHAAGPHAMDTLHLTSAERSAQQLAAAPTAAVSAFFLFVGFEWVTSSQPGSRKAAAQLPRVLLAAVAVLGGVYIVFSAAALMHLDAEQLAATRTPQMLLARIVWGEPGRWVMLAISTSAVLMAFNAGVLGASRLVYGLAREGCLPRSLTATAANSGAPVRAIAATVAVSLVCSLAAGALQLGDLLGNVAAVIICLCYAALLAASLVLARRAAKPGAATVTAAFVVEAGALLAMGLLLLALLFDPAAWRQSVTALFVCGVCWLCAAHTNSRANSRDQRHKPSAAATRTA